MLFDYKCDFQTLATEYQILENKCKNLQAELEDGRKFEKDREEVVRIIQERDWLRHELEQQKKVNQECYDVRTRERERDHSTVEALRSEIEDYQQRESNILKREDAWLEERGEVAAALNYQTAFGTLVEWAAEVKKVAEFQNQRADKLEESLLCYMPGHCFRLNHRPTIGNFCPECNPHKSAADRITEIQKRVVLAEDCVRSANEAADKWEKRYRENFSTAMSVSKHDLDVATKEVTDLKTKLADKDKLAEEATVLVLMLFRIVMNVKAAINKPNNSTTIWNSSETNNALLELQLAINDKKAEVFYQYEQSLVTVAAAASILHQAVNQQEMEMARDILRNALKECGEQRARMFE